VNATQAIHGLLSDALKSGDVHLLGEALELSPATRGLLAVAPKQVHLLPAADATLIGLAVGLAMSGSRAVIELSGPAALWGILQQLGQEATLLSG
jgi:pyruvate/2-oxoglutarate/acetoin dehydrogenase E1 component